MTRSPDRFIVFNVRATKAFKRGYGDNESCSRRTYTSYGDAAKATVRCSRQGKTKGVASVASQPCLLLHGLPGSERLVGRCLKGKCGPPESGDLALMQRCKIDKADKKKARLGPIEAAAARSRQRIVRERARGIITSKASKSRTISREKLAAEQLSGRSKRTKRRR